MNENFAERLKELRMRKHMTQDDLANRLGISRQAISKWERGEGYPDLYNVQRLAKVLEVSVDELINDTQIPSPEKPVDSDPDEPSGNYLKRLLYKAKHTSNSAQAKKIKRILLLVGGLGVLAGVIMVISGFVGFDKGAMDSIQNFPFGNGGVFNPLPFMGLFMGGGVVFGLSLYVLLGGLSIVIAGVATNYLDPRPKCPKCGNEIDKDEKMCSNCGQVLNETLHKVCSCGKENQPEDRFCRSCGQKLS